MISGDVVDHCLDVVNKSITPTIFVIVVSKCTVNLLPHKLHVAKMGFTQVNSEAPTGPNCSLCARLRDHMCSQWDD